MPMPAQTAKVVDIKSQVLTPIFLADRLSKIQTLLRRQQEVAEAIIRHADVNTWRCWPSVARICSRSKFSRATVFRALKEIEALGMITRLSRRGEVTTYQVNPKEIETMLSNDATFSRTRLKKTQVPVSKRDTEQTNRTDHIPPYIPPKGGLQQTELFDLPEPSKGNVVAIPDKQSRLLQKHGKARKRRLVQEYPNSFEFLWKHWSEVGLSAFRGTSKKAACEAFCEQVLVYKEKFGLDDEEAQVFTVKLFDLYLEGALDRKERIDRQHARDVEYAVERGGYRPRDPFYGIYGIVSIVKNDKLNDIMTADQGGREALVEALIAVEGETGAAHPILDDYREERAAGYIDQWK